MSFCIGLDVDFFMAYISLGYAITLKILLDICCIIWAIAEPDPFSSAAADLLEAEDALISVSPISAAEIACAAERWCITLRQHWKTWFHKYVELNAWHVGSIGLNIIEEAYSLPGQFHADPADRILVSTARLQGRILLTADRKILDYPHVKTA